MMDDPEAEEGAPVAAQPPHPLALFYASLYGATPRVWVTKALIAANVAVFALMVAKGVHPMTPTTDSLLKWGADQGLRTTAGEWWRLGSSMFLHIGVVHLAMNMLVLYQVGPFVERLYGNLGFLFAYLLSGLLGSLTSVALDPYVVSAGASGAVFGAYGLLLGYVVRCKGSIPGEASSQLLSSSGRFLVINLIYGLSSSGINMAAHVGGLAAGFLLGLAQALPIEVTTASRVRRGVAVALLGLTLAAAIGAALPRTVDFVTELFDLEGRLDQKYNTAVEHNASSDEWVRLLGQDILPERRTYRTRLDGLALHGRPDRRRDRLSRYMAARQEAWELMLAGIQENNLDKIKAGSAKMNQSAKLLQSSPKDE